MDFFMIYDFSRQGHGRFGKKYTKQIYGAISAKWDYIVAYYFHRCYAVAGCYFKDNKFSIYL